MTTQLEREAEEYAELETARTDLVLKARRLNPVSSFRAGCHLGYVQGWRACRTAMLAVANARLSYKGLDIGMIESFGEEEAHEQT